MTTVWVKHDVRWVIMPVEGAGWEAREYEVIDNQPVRRDVLKGETLEAVMGQLGKFAESRMPAALRGLKVSLGPVSQVRPGDQEPSAS